MRVLVMLLCSTTLFAQDVAEPFTFQPATSATAAPPTWWCIAATPDGTTLFTGHQFADRGEVWVWDVLKGQVVGTWREPNGVRSLAVSPSGDVVATANFDHQVRVYDAKTFKLLAQSDEKDAHTAGVNSIAFSGDSRRLVSAGLDHKVHVWVWDGKLTLRNVLEGHTEGVLSVAMNPDGTEVLSGSLDRTARVWTVPEKVGEKGTKERLKFTTHTAAIESVAWSPDGARLATGSWDNTAKLWDTTGTEIGTLRGHTRGILALRFSPDSQTLVTTTGDENSAAAGEVRVWSASRGTDFGLVGKHEDMIRGVAFGASSRLVFSMGRDRAIRVWNTATKQQERLLRTPADTPKDAPIITAVSHSPDGKYLAYAEDTGRIRVQERSTRNTFALEGHTGPVHGLAWVGNTQLGSVGADRTAKVWNIATKQVVHSWPHPGVVYAVAVSPDGKTIATGGFDMLIRLFESTTGKEVGQKRGHTASVRTLAFAPSGKVLASGGSDHVLRTWDMTKEAAPVELRGHTRAVRALHFLNETTLVSGSDDRLVKMWNLPESECTFTTVPHADSVQALTVSPKGSFFLAGIGNGDVHVYEAVDGSPRLLLTGGTDSVAGLSITPDGTEIVAGGYDRRLRIWNAIKQQTHSGIEFRGHRGAVWAVAIAPDGQLVLTAGQDGTLRLWDAVSGKEQHQWLAHEGGVHDVAWSRDGRWFVSGGADHTAKLWDATTRKLERTFKPDVGELRCVALSNSGSLLAVGGRENNYALYSRTDDKPLGRMALDAPAKKMHFLGEDDLLLVTTNGKAQYWSTKETRVLRQLDSGRFAWAKSISGSQDGTYILVTGREPAAATGTSRPSYNITLMFDSPQTTVQPQRIYHGPDEVTAVVSADRGNVFAATLADGQALVWENVALGQEPLRLRKFYAHAARIHGMAISSDGRYIVTASADGTARRWNAARGEALVYAAKLLDESKQTWFATPSPDGTTLVTGGDDQRLRIRRALPGHYRKLPGEYQAAYTTALTNGGALLATGHHDGVIRIWDTKTGEALRKLDEHNQRIWALAFTDDGSRMVSVGGDWNNSAPGEVRVWDTTTWKPLHKLAAHNDLIFTVAIAPDGKTFATGSRDRLIRTWDMATGNEVTSYTGHTAGVRSLVFANKGQELLSCGHDRRVIRWDIASKKQLTSRLFDGAGLEKMRLAPDGATLALSVRTGPNRGQIVVWDSVNDKVLHEFKTFVGQVNDVAFSPDGRTLVGVGGHYAQNPFVTRGATGPYAVQVSFRGEPMITVPTSEIKLYDLTAGRPLLDLPGAMYWIEAVQFTPDGKQLITAGGVQDRPGEVRLWDATGFRPAHVLEGQGSPVTAAVFNKDGTRLATTGTNNVLLWDMTNKPPTFRELRGPTGMVRQVRFLPDGRIVAGGDDGTLHLWDMKGEPVPFAFPRTQPIYGLEVSGDGTQLAVALGNDRTGKPGEVRVLEVATGKELFQVSTPQPAWSVAFVGTNHLAVGQQGAAPVAVFDLTTKREERALAFADDLRSFRTQPGQPWLVGLGGRTGLLTIWNERTWQSVYEVPAHPGKVAFHAAFTKDGQTLATAGGDGAVLWQFPRPTWPAPKAP